ncbi:tagatose-bisphosphate aldolase [Thermoanaerobacterium thermosaccharolyticum]|uniref:D-tagatose-bisphosphate aldolase class II accessory protein n=1 Tax=Thermoanaerobacterium thermosaccharolyticum TaxID=1517 RepID=A0A223HVJ3_THETR|nr:class II D-tagatose-bisphosphate aldolase, non-catalytic subunit [Thermoanaerobacterium thermosaccharolyticum]AST56523.1 D-tagatose-bisphosphate aldolase class II accessory protein [Thermoanaerobacterium thermosaccharolyticum]PHO08533.1 tagatose-bisphosphate aldolase [Thermoanaerobacterium thermosaccharolyticum]
MAKEHPLKELVNKQKSGISEGIVSICSSNEFVIEASMERALTNGDYVLIESTANQVNQYGGYIGMTPIEFKKFVFSIAKKVDFPLDKLILGGDHLGPLIWKNESSNLALAKASELIKEYVLAGYTKIHIDTSMRLKDDTDFNTEIIAQRSAVLLKAAENAYMELNKNNKNVLHPVYVIGSEVPIPGGSQGSDESLQITDAKDFENTVEIFKDVFSKYGLINEWENIVAFVVQPGVEFGNDFVHEYKRDEAKELTDALKNYKTFVFEGHSTDYQTRESLKQMVEDGIAILKVGPALTFALREALIALNNIENELLNNVDSIKLSNFTNVLVSEMINNPEHWKNHYFGDDARKKFLCKYSYSDRCRYYLPTRNVKNSLNLLIRNLENVKIPMTLISQFMPLQYDNIRRGLIKNEPISLIKNAIMNRLNDYYYAIKP